MAANIDAQAAPRLFSPEDFARRARARLRQDPPPFTLPGHAGPGDPPGVPDEAPYDTAPHLREAAVLIPVVSHAGAASVLLTQRTADLPSHAGQIAFPGGKVDPGDASALDTALREAKEEIGLDPALVTPLGFLDPHHSRTGYLVTGVVGLVRPDFRLVLNEAEVAEAFEVPLSFLMTRANHGTHIRTINGTERSLFAMPFGRHFIWGLTAMILKDLGERIYDA